jgi:hypothetical protein
LPGYSHETLAPGSAEKASRFVQNVDLSASMALTPNFSVIPSFIYEEAGNYFYNLSLLEFELRF